MFKNNFKINKACPICKSENIENKNKIPSKHQEIDHKFSLMLCKICGHKFLSEFPSKIYLEELHKNDSKFLFSHDTNEVIEKERFKKNGFEKVKILSDHWIFKFVDINQGGEYLEIGPGLCALYKTFHNKNWHCQGLDLQPFINSPGIVNNLDEIKNESKDIAVALDVIEHTIDPLDFLKNIKIKLKNGGKIFLSFPNADSFKSKILNNKWDMVVPLAHLNFFSKKSIQICLEKNDFEIIFIKNYSMGNFKRFIKNLIKLPFKLLKDLINLNIIIFLTRLKETIITLLDIINGDQMMVVAKKIVKIN